MCTRKPSFTLQKYSLEIELFLKVLNTFKMSSSEQEKVYWTSVGSTYLSGQAQDRAKQLQQSYVSEKRQSADLRATQQLKRAVNQAEKWKKKAEEDYQKFVDYEDK
jgi:hypothetical protein